MLCVRELSIKPYFDLFRVECALDLALLRGVGVLKLQLFSILGHGMIGCVDAVADNICSTLPVLCTNDASDSDVEARGGVYLPTKSFQRCAHASSCTVPRIMPSRSRSLNCAFVRFKRMVIVSSSLRYWFIRSMREMSMTSM